MYPAEVVIHEPESDGSGMIFELFRETIRQTSKAPNTHSHGKVLALHVGRAHMFRIGVSANNFHVCSDTGSRRIAGFVLSYDAINFLELGVINVGTKGVLYCVKIHAMAVCGDLNSATNAVSAVLHELVRPTRAASAYQIAHAEFCIGIYGRPSPYIAPSDLAFCERNISGLGTHELPNFITLKSANAKVANVQVMIFGTSVGKVKQEIDYSILRNARHSHRRADGISFDQGRHNTCFLLDC